MWSCLCECGTVSDVYQVGLLRGGSNGCKKHGSENNNKRTHGCSATREYRIWQGMKSRCLNEKYKFYYLYGGRGIKICAEWLESFENFFTDMGLAPAGFTLERKDVNGNYEPENCEWIPKGAQMENTSKTIRVQNGGVVSSLKKFCIAEGLIYHRVKPRVLKIVHDRSIPISAEYVLSLKENGKINEVPQEF